MKYLTEPFSQCNNIILEAKRVLLNEQLDRIANATLASDILISIETNSTTEPSCGVSTSSVDSTDLPEANESSTEQFNQVPNEDILLNKYFQKWRSFIRYKREQPEYKLDNFISNLQQYQKEPEKNHHLLPKPQTGCFKNRYKTQKTIIDLQRSKIEEQTKIINELKLGIIREDLLKSIENTRIEIREIFSDCSERLLTKAPLLQDVDEREKIMVYSQKAPKMRQTMHRRAIERARYREIILERKRLIEEARQRLLEEAIEKKRALEEEERKHNLEMISEQRKRQLQLQKMRQEKRLEFEKKLNLAIDFFNNSLKKQCFRKLFINYLKAKENETLADRFYLQKQISRVYNTWWGYVEDKYKMKYAIADAHFNLKILKKCFDVLKQHKLECVQSLQVAEDLYNFRLTSNTFIHWHRYVCKQIMLERKMLQIAINHHDRRILFQYFYQWRSLPVVIQLERAKEEKKRKWREKVWEILPDYQPPEVF